MNVAVLAWGSLVWNPRGLKVGADFEPIGPRLSVEFSRVSGDGRLTLVIDELVGATCATFAAPSGFFDLDSALENLWMREGVGFVDRISGQASAKVETINAWAAGNGWDAVIWTALASNFSDWIGEPFSVEAAIRYLKARDGPTFDKALTYIRRAPEMQTPVRAAVHARWPEG